MASPKSKFVVDLRPKRPKAPYVPSYMAEGQLCTVCGDFATGLHYRAITCEGCKGFWRRSEQRHLVYVCKTGRETCDINKDSRNGCQRCRYNKCKAVGMSSDLVLNETERAQKRELIKGNRQRRKVEEVLAVLKTEQREKQELSAVIAGVTRSYCKHIDLAAPKTSAADLSIEGHYEFLVHSLLERSHEFGSAIKIYCRLPPEAQNTLLKESMLEICMLRFVSYFDPVDACYHPPGQKAIRMHDLENLLIDNLFCHELMESLLLVSRNFAALQLDLRQMALLSALFLLNPDNHLESTEYLTKTHYVLWDALRNICEEFCELPDPKQWAFIMTRIVEFRLLCRQLQKLTPLEQMGFLSMILGE